MTIQALDNIDDEDIERMLSDMKFNQDNDNK